MTGQTPPPGAALRPGLEVLDLMGWGHTRATAARLLHIGDNAASKRLTRLYQALGARNGCHAIGPGLPRRTAAPRPTGRVVVADPHQWIRDRVATGTRQMQMVPLTALRRLLAERDQLARLVAEQLLDEAAEADDAD